MSACSISGDPTNVLLAGCRINAQAAWTPLERPPIGRRDLFICDVVTAKGFSIPAEMEFLRRYPCEFAVIGLLYQHICCILGIHAVSYSIASVIQRRVYCQSDIFAEDKLHICSSHICAVQPTHPCGSFGIVFGG